MWNLATNTQHSFTLIRSNRIEMPPIDQMSSLTWDCICWHQKMLTSCSHQPIRLNRLPFTKLVCKNSFTFDCICNLISLFTVIVHSLGRWWKYIQRNSAKTSKRSNENHANATFFISGWYNAIDNSNTQIGEYQCCNNGAAAIHCRTRSQCAGRKISELFVCDFCTN